MIVHDKEPIEAFCSRNHGPFPDVDPASWRLCIDGLVDRELVLSLVDLQQRFAPAPKSSRSSARETGAPGCSPSGTSGAGAVGFGDHLHGRMDRCQPRGRAGRAWTSPTAAPVPLPKARSGEVLLAWGMNGAPLPQIHGDPVRMVVPDYIGARSVKWGQRITNQTEPSRATSRRRTIGCCCPTPNPARPRHLPGAADDDVRDPLS